MVYTLPAIPHATREWLQYTLSQFRRTDDFFIKVCHFNEVKSVHLTVDEINNEVSDMQSPQISVIIPVYNVEPYIRKCIDSILNQTFRDFEILLVDDGSTDRSGAICDEYALKDARIRVFHTPNRGVSAARNLGIDQALGEWITFVDSDDWVEEGYLSCFFQTELGAKAIVYQNRIHDYTAYRKKNKVAFSYKDISFDATGIIRAISDYKILSDCYVTTKMFKKEVIRQYSIRFCESISLAEDMLFVRQYLYHIEEVHLHALPAYHYTTRNSNLTSNHHSSEERILIFKRLQKSIISLLKKFPISDPLYTKDLYSSHGLVHLIGACKEVNKNNYKAIFAYVRLQKDLFAKYYISPTIGSRIFQKIFFNKILPDNLILLSMLYRKTITVKYKIVIDFLSKCRGE